MFDITLDTKSKNPKRLQHFFWAFVGDATLIEGSVFEVTLEFGQFDTCICIIRSLSLVYIYIYIHTNTYQYIPIHTNI